MGNRIIKETICTSEKLSRLTDFEFRLWLGLITLADDYGCGDGRAVIIRNFVFPLREGLSTARVEKALQRLAEEDCIRFYESGGQRYFWFPTWLDHQRLRSHKPRWPQPPELEPIVTRKREEEAVRKALRKKKGKEKASDFEAVYERFEAEEAAELEEEMAAEDAVFERVQQRAAAQFMEEQRRKAMGADPEDDGPLRRRCMELGIPLA